MTNNSEVQSRKVYFESEGSTLVGVLRSPANAANERLPLIIIAPSWINVKEQFAAIYGERLAMCGYHTLTFDFRNYGQSEGEPRNYEVPLNKVTDFKNAISYAATLPEQAGIYVVGVADKLKKSRAAREQYEKTGEVIYAPKVSLTDSEAAMFGDFTYYLNTNRGLIPEWEAGKFAVMSWEPWLTYDPNPNASKISCPVLMVHSEQAALPDQVKKFFAAITCLPK
jgi:uncharacterized protein